MIFLPARSTPRSACETDMTSPNTGLRSGAAPEAIDVGYINPAFVPRPWLRTADEDAEPVPATTPRQPPVDTILEGDSSDQERSEHVGAGRQKNETNLRIDQNMPQTEGIIPAPSVPKWGRNANDSRPHVQSHLYEATREYEPLTVGWQSNQGDAFPFVDVVTYVEQGQTARGYMQPTTYTPRPDPYGKYNVTFPSDGPATGDHPSTWS